MIEEFARAKVNLSLEIRGRFRGGPRAGYHALESLVVFPNIGDRIVVEKADGLSFVLEGAEQANLKGMRAEDNLVIKAATALQQACGTSQGARITLEKNLPVASGIGGGSADAAATLRALLKLWKDDLSDMAPIAPMAPTALEELALSLGADVPVALFNKPALMSGIGEHIEPLSSLPSFGLVLVNCGVWVATAEVFRELKAKEISDVGLPRVPELERLGDLVSYLEDHPNHLEEPAIRLAPDIAETLSLLRGLSGAHLVRMSGSGATCFALFKTAQQAEAAAAVIRSERPKWWVEAGEV